MQRGASRVNTVEEAVAVLLKMGMGQYFVDRIPNDQLLRLANSIYIQSIVTYVRYDVFGNSEYVEPAVAHQVAESSRIAEDSGYVFEETTNGFLPRNTDGLLRLEHIAFRETAVSMVFYTNAHWVEMPLQRRIDSIGSIADNIALEEGTFGGWISYESRRYERIGNTLHFRDTTFVGMVPRNTAESFVINGNFRGWALAFEMPNTGIMRMPGWNREYHLVPRDVRISFAFAGDIQHAVSFNSIPSYTHSVSGASGWSNVSISISIPLGAASMSIGLSPSFAPNQRRWYFVMIIRP
jgi:hypothetical protein